MCSGVITPTSSRSQACSTPVLGAADHGNDIRLGIFMAAPLRRAAPICGCMWESKGVWEDVMGGFLCAPLAFGMA